MTANALHLGPAIGHVTEVETPWVDIPEGEYRLVHADPAADVWVTASRLNPGIVVPTHRHTGHVNAWTTSGRWFYREYGVMYEAGSYVYEPEGSVHTLMTPADNPGITEVVFVIHGANIDIDDDGNTLSVLDASNIGDIYRDLCRQQGKAVPRFIEG